jgi:adenylate cyclase
MLTKRISILTMLGPALVFSLLYLTGWFVQAEYRLYDIFLRLRPERQRFGGIVFLDVDDEAVARAGVFPWPRSIMADGFLRLKEYGARAAILDIEYVDSSPAQVNEDYLRQGLRTDINQSFSEIAAQVTDMTQAIGAGRLRGESVGEVLDEVRAYIMDEGERLYAGVQSLRRDNDEYFAQATALFGRAWLTVNIQAEPLSGEQAERRAISEERFSRLVQTVPESLVVGGGVDILPTIPALALAARGAGFTNVIIDKDGVRRRVYLVRKVGDYWYAQLAFAPLLEYMGNPEMELRPGELVLRGAVIPAPDGSPNGGEEKRTIRVPLDERGAMLLDWPKATYLDSYRHISFAALYGQEEAQTGMIQYLSALSYLDNYLFPRLAAESGAALDEFGAAEKARSTALRDCSEDAFAEFLAARDRGLAAVETLLAAAAEDPPAQRAGELARDNPDQASFIMEESDYARELLDYLGTVYSRYRDAETRIRAEFAGKLCVVGRADTGSVDMGTNPFHTEYVNAGTHGVVLDTVLSGSFMRPLSPLWSALCCLLLVPLVMPVYGLFKPGARILLGFAGAALILGISFILFLRGIFLGPLGPALSLLFTVIIRETLAFVTSERDKQFYRKAFATYTSEAVAEQIAQNPSLLQLGGSKRQMSAIFTDIRGFSTISEKLSPEELVTLLNRYLTVMSDVVLDNEGTIDKYEGDAIIAFFGAPLEQPDHALRACLSAIKMKRLENELNKTVLEEKLTPLPLLTRIGINTGDMVAGNMGTDKKMNYTIMGDAVNLAARLEGVNKQYDTWILASEETVRETGGRILTRRLDRVRVVGKREPVQLYDLVNTMEDATENEKKLVKVFHRALDMFDARDWNAAKTNFGLILKHFPGDGPSKIFFERAETYRQNPPAADWDGVVNLTTK